MKRYLKIATLFIFVWSVIIGVVSPAHAEDSINEKFGLPIVVYGDTLSDAQKQEVRDLLGVTDPNNVKEFSVTGQDIANYINGDLNRSEERRVGKECSYRVMGSS